MKNSILLKYSKQSITVLLSILAIVSALSLWHYDRVAPWTRDGRVRADWVSVAPDVSGLVSEVDVRDNQKVVQGTVLFRIDPKRFSIALVAAKADLLQRIAAMREARHEAKRYKRLLRTGNTSPETAEKMETRSLEATALYQKSLSNLMKAQLDLARSTVRAKVNGFVTNLHLRPGDFIARGKGVMALIDSGSYYIDGYFEETKLPSIKVGDLMEIRIMGISTKVFGHVESIAHGISDFERSDQPGTVPRVNPTFSWVRLAQRVPVRVKLDKIPSGMRLVSGLTATIIDRSSHRPD